MTDPSFFERHFGKTLEEVAGLDPESRAGAVRGVVPDLHFFLDDGRAFEDRDAPERSRALARSLHDALAAGEGPAGPGRTPPAGARAGLSERIITDRLLREESDRDQNVYLGQLFTRRLTRAVPDLVFQPSSVAECATALRWARAQGVPVTLRGAASTAMGGAVPNDGGLLLDASRLDGIEVDAADRVCVVGAGARLRAVHQRLAERGFALRVYPSNLGGTLAGWFVTGGVGLNAFGAGRALDSVRAADVLLPSGEHVRFHDDGRLDVPEEGARRRTLPAEASAEWFRGRGLEPMTLADLAGSEGILGLVLQLIVAIEPRPEFGAFLLGFATEPDAIAAADWVRRGATVRFGAPSNLKLLSASHLHHVREVWKDEDARIGDADPGGRSVGAHLPWTRIVGPEALGAQVAADGVHECACLYVDFTDLAAARAFAAALPECPGAPATRGAESVRFAAERFRPQQSKRFGPGLVAAEILMPADEVMRFLPRAGRMARNVGAALETEVYYLADGQALVIGATLTDHRRAGYLVDLALAPALLDLAMASHGGRPYVLGRWQSAWVRRRFGREGAERIRSMKRALDPAALVNRGVLLGLRLRGVLGALLAAGFTGGMAATRVVFSTPGLSALARVARGVLGGFGGPARGRGAPAVAGVSFRARPPEDPIAEPGVRAGDDPRQRADDRALHCVNCGECNTVCPVFVDSRIRLPQMLTHLGEAVRGGASPPPSGSVLLDLCMRCGNCEEVCQAGIPHLPIYQELQRVSDRTRPPDRERHAAIVMAVRGGPHYARDFLHVRPGGYLKRSPAALPGTPRFVVLRSENDAGPAATCIHCGACVAVCPTHANREFEGADPRWITTLQERCIGCGTCVEVCPANLASQGRTLRVMETPTLDWFAALAEFESKGGA